MKRCAKVLVIVGLLWAALCQAAGTEQGTIRLAIKEKAVISGGVIELRNVVQLSEDAPAKLASLCLGNAPWPGYARKISRALIKVRMASCGFDLNKVAFSGPEHCLVQSDAVRIESQQIVDVARRYLELSFPKGGPEVKVELLKEVAAVLVTAGGKAPQLRASLFGSGPAVGRVRVEVEILRGGVRLKRIPVSFQVRLFGQVAISKKRIAAGQKIMPADVTVARREMTSVHGTPVESCKELTGKVAVRNVYPGQIITRSMVQQAQQPIVIDYNQRVFLVWETKTLRVVTIGKSLCRARRGEIARAKNLGTGREVVGVAGDGSTIKVLLEGSSGER